MNAVKLEVKGTTVKTRARGVVAFGDERGGDAAAAIVVLGLLLMMAQQGQAAQWRWVVSSDTQRWIERPAVVGQRTFQRFTLLRRLPPRPLLRLLNLLPAPNDRAVSTTGSEPASAVDDLCRPGGDGAKDRRLGRLLQRDRMAGTAAAGRWRARAGPSRAVRPAGRTWV